MSCEYCGKDALYSCSICGKQLCAEHLKLRTICPSNIKKTTFEYTTSKVAVDKERKKVGELVQRFWGEEEQLTFDRKLSVAELPTYTAKIENTIIGLISARAPPIASLFKINAILNYNKFTPRAMYFEKNFLTW